MGSNILNWVNSNKWFKAVLPVLLAGLFCLHGAGGPALAGSGWTPQAAIGSSLLAGIPNDSVTWYMPFYGTAVSAALNCGLSYAAFVLLLRLGIFALVFCCGSLLCGYWCGAVSLAGAGLAELAYLDFKDPEQYFYTFLLLLLLALLAVKRGKDNTGNSLLAGLAAGFSLLARTPLFLFPPVWAACEWLFTGARSRAYFLRALAFIAASYVLLLPWAGLNYSVAEKLSLPSRLVLFERGRGDCNILGGALGSVYTMEGDCRKLAGISDEDSAFGFWVRSVVMRPFFHADAALKRAWHIFLFCPALFAAFGLALAFGRGKEKKPLAALPLYFLFIHALLPIEKRYFYPLLFLLPPLLFGVLAPESTEEPERRSFAERGALLVFWLTFCAVLLLEALVCAYPYRAARNSADGGYLQKALARFPNDALLQDLKCRDLLRAGDEAGFYACLGAYSRKFDEKLYGFYLSAAASRAPAALAVPGERRMDCLIARMLREYELGQKAEAAESYRLAYAAYTLEHNMLRGQPYGRDKELAAAIGGDSARFWDRYVYGILLLWPQEGMVKILSAIDKDKGLSGNLKAFAGYVSGKDKAAAGRLRALRADNIPGMGYGILPVDKTAEVKRYSDYAVNKIIAGDLAGAKVLLLKALELDSRDPGALMNLCAVLARQDKPGEAVSYCRAAADAAYGIPQFRTLACDASFQSYTLLKTLGRGAEAEKELRRAVENAPPSWPRLAEAEALLKK